MLGHAIPNAAANLEATFSSRVLDRLRRPLPALIALQGLGLAVLGGVILLSHLTGKPISIYTRDPVTVMRAGPATGFLSNVGILFWCSAAAVCWFTAAVLRGRRHQREVQIWLMSSGLLTSILLLDDFFLLHEHVLPRLLKVEEDAVSLSYLGLTALYLWRFRRSILASDCILLFLALGLFSCSMALDWIGDERARGHFLLEDGSKFLGILNWMGFFVLASLQALAPMASRAKVPSWLTRAHPVRPRREP